MKLSHLSRASNLSRLLPASLLISGLVTAAGCAGDVVVAEKDLQGPDKKEEGRSNEDVPTVVTYQAGETADECAEQYESRTAGHDRWAEATNDFGEIENTTWTGDLLFVGQNGGGMDVKLELGELGGTIALGEQIPLQADAPYPKTETMYFDWGLIEGVTYTLRGAKFEEDELVLIVPPTSFLEEWCHLQTPTFDENNECRYSPHRSVGVGTVDGEPGQCALSDDPDFVRDCEWYQQTILCGCTPDECYGDLNFPEVQAHETAEDYSDHYIVFRLAHDAEANSLSGAAVYGDREYFFDLSRP